MNLLNGIALLTIAKKISSKDDIGEKARVAFGITPSAKKEEPKKEEPKKEEEKNGDIMEGGAGSDVLLTSIGPNNTRTLPQGAISTGTQVAIPTQNLPQNQGGSLTLPPGSVILQQGPLAQTPVVVSPQPQAQGYINPPYQQPQQQQPSAGYYPQPAPPIYQPQPAPQPSAGYYPQPAPPVYQPQPAPQPAVQPPTSAPWWQGLAQQGLQLLQPIAQAGVQAAVDWIQAPPEEDLYYVPDEGYYSYDELPYDENEFYTEPAGWI